MQYCNTGTIKSQGREAFFCFSNLLGNCNKLVFSGIVVRSSVGHKSKRITSERSMERSVVYITKSFTPIILIVQLEHKPLVYFVSSFVLARPHARFSGVLPTMRIIHYILLLVLGENSFIVPCSERLERLLPNATSGSRIQEVSIAVCP